MKFSFTKFRFNSSLEIVRMKYALEINVIKCLEV